MQLWQNLDSRDLIFLQFETKQRSRGVKYSRKIRKRRNRKITFCWCTQSFMYKKVSSKPVWILLRNLEILVFLKKLWWKDCIKMFALQNRKSAVELKWPASVKFIEILKILEINISFWISTWWCVRNLMLRLIIIFININISLLGWLVCCYLTVLCNVSIEINLTCKYVVWNSDYRLNMT